MDTLKTILVGVDFTAPSKAALQQALRLGAFSRAAVKAAYILDTIVTIELEAAMSPMALQVQADLVKEARSAWEEFRGTVPGAGAVECHIEVNNRSFGLLHYAKDIGADLIVIGAWAKKPDTGFGTMATAAVRHAACDVLLVREDQPGPFKTVVAAVDFSPTSMRALERAVRIATQDSASLHILHVAQAPWDDLQIRVPIPVITPDQRRAFFEGLAGRLQEFCRPLEHELSYLKPTYAVHEAGGHRSGIAAYAQEHKADLLVLGTRGRTSLRDILLGSTAEKALRSATCSVLAIRPASK